MNNFFHFPEKDVITPYFISQNLRDSQKVIANAHLAVPRSPATPGLSAFSKDGLYPAALESTSLIVVPLPAAAQVVSPARPLKIKGLPTLAKPSLGERFIAFHLPIESKPQPADSEVPFEVKGITDLKKTGLKDQFFVFQLSPKLDEPSILDSTQVVPAIDGSEQEPDVLVHLELQSFNVSEEENIEGDSRATMRINFGKDENSRDKCFDTVFWSIAAGLNLYNHAKNKPAEGNEFRSDFRKAFGNRPIEIPGGLSKLSFEVVKHKEPPWYNRIFKFLTSDTGGALISVLGFPAITTQAIQMLDELMNRLDGSKPEVLFKSLPMKLALTQQAKRDYTWGSERVEIGCLNPGFCILARGRDYSTFLHSNAVYNTICEKLVPVGVSKEDLLSGNYDDPFKDITYAIIKVGMMKKKLDPSFNYG